MNACSEMAKKLPREKQVCLLNCLEASLAICGMFSDPPEDAVVTVCGHVFWNQRISGHLTGDDTQCPTKTCKTRLDISSVFSVTTLRIALSVDGLRRADVNGSGSEEAQVSEPCPLRCPYDSSKINAAIEVLLSLSKPQACTSRTSSSESSVEPSCSENLPGKANENPDWSGCSNTSVKVVGEKAIVFSQWTRMLDLLESCLRTLPFNTGDLMEQCMLVPETKPERIQYRSRGYCYDNVSKSCKPWTEQGCCSSSPPFGLVVEPNY